MIRPRLIALATALAMAGTFGGAALAQSFTPQQRSEIEKIVKEYLIAHPEVLQEVVAEIEKRQTDAQSAKQQTAVSTHAAALFNSKHQVVLGNPKGDVTLVEFFDYNCGYCKRALADMMGLLEADKNLRVVLKEFPVLGEASVQAAQVAVAVHMQDTSGKKYLDFHRKLLQSRGRADRAKAMAVAKEVGLDTDRIERDSKSPEVRATLEEVFKLAQELGLNGTPSYVVGSDVVIGAVGAAALKEKISKARCGKPTC